MDRKGEPAASEEEEEELDDYYDEQHFLDANTINAKVNSMEISTESLLRELHVARKSIDQNLTHIIRSKGKAHKSNKNDVRVWIDNVKNNVAKSNSKDQYINAVINTFNYQQDNNNNKQPNRKPLNQKVDESGSTIENTVFKEGDAENGDTASSSTMRIPWRWLEKTVLIQPTTGFDK